MKVSKHIRVDVFFTPLELDEMYLKDKNIVVIDVLRSSASIATALQNGAKEIIPVSNIESAVKISGSLFGDVTLRAGERNSKMIDGFNLGNSPAEFAQDIVKGKSIIFMTTNGSGAILKGRYAKNLVVASFVNLSAVISFLKTLVEDFVIICAGAENNFCIEDAVCAGKIIEGLKKEIDHPLILNDAGSAAVALNKHHGRSILKMLRSSEHGKYLLEIGFDKDLKVCGEIDSIHILPQLMGNVLRISKTAGISSG